MKEKPPSFKMVFLKLTNQLQRPESCRTPKRISAHVVTGAQRLNDMHHHVVSIKSAGVYNKQTHRVPKQLA